MSTFGPGADSVTWSIDNFGAGGSKTADVLREDAFGKNGSTADSNHRILLPRNTNFTLELQKGWGPYQALKNLREAGKIDLSDSEILKEARRIRDRDKAETGRTHYDKTPVPRWSDREISGMVKTAVSKAVTNEAKNVVPTYESWKEQNTENKPENIRVLTFNIGQGNFGLAGAIELIRSSGADVVGLQESAPNAAKIAKDLGFNYVQSGYSTILTRFKIDSVTPGGSGIIVKTDDGKQFAFFDKHMYYKPYQPYQLLNIPYENAPFISTESEAVDEARKARGTDVEDLRKDIESLKDAGLPTIVVGDFNEPSHLDWTKEAARIGRHPIKVDWPASKAMEAQGFKDAYRQMLPDEIKNPGYTWTPLTKPNDPKDHHDRIDFIHYRGDDIELKSVAIIGEDAAHADQVVTPFPSDHRAVTAVFELKGASK